MENVSKHFEYINKYLHRKKQLYQPSNIKHVLSKLQIWDENHYWVLSISTEVNKNLKQILIFN